VPIYRYYYLDSADRVAATEVLHWETDAYAQVRADRLLAASHHSGIEVGDRSQVIYRARKADAPPRV
jgi:hypothetical protein